MSGCRPDHACCHEARALKSEKAALELRVKELEELNAGNVADFLNELNGFKLRAEKAEADLAAAEKVLLKVQHYDDDTDPLALIRSYFKRAAGRESGVSTKPQGRRLPENVPTSGERDSRGMGSDAAAQSAARINPCPRCGGSRDPDDERECAG